jgi:D-alanyl-D-alanine carboxypeptidase
VPDPERHGAGSRPRFVMAALLAVLAVLVSVAGPVRAGEPLSMRDGASRPNWHRGVRPLDEPPPGWRAAARLARARAAAASPELAAELASALDAARYGVRSFGATVAIVHDGQMVWSGASGVAQDGQTPLRADGPMIIGSITKTFTSALVLQLVEDGTLALDDRVADLLPGSGGIAGEATLSQLLEHSSGLADLFNGTTEPLLASDPGRTWTPEQALAALPPAWYQPGADWAYSNANYLLLAMILEEQLDEPLATALKTRITRPLGLTSVRAVDPADGASAPLTPGWASLFWGSGSMVASVNDLARWGDALYGSDAVIEATTRAQMLAFNEHDHGLGVQKLAIGDGDAYGHSGLLLTCTSVLVHLPDADLTIAVTVNRSEVDIDGMLASAAPGQRSLIDLAYAAAGVAPRVATIAPGP